jgi:hypothetical protein
MYLAFALGEASNLGGIILLPLLSRSDMRIPEDEGRVLTSEFGINHGLLSHSRVERSGGHW